MDLSRGVILAWDDALPKYLYLSQLTVVVIEHWLNYTITKKVYIYASGFKSLKSRYSNQLSKQLFDDCAVLDQSKFYGYHHSDHLNGRCQAKLSRGTVYYTDSARNPWYYHQQLKLAKNSSFLSHIDSDILTKETI